MSEFRLGFREKELLRRLPETPTAPDRAYPEGLTRTQREVYTRALRRLQDHGLAYRYPLLARGGRGKDVKSALTTDGVAAREVLRATRAQIVERAAIVSEELCDWQRPKAFSRREKRLNRMIDDLSRLGTVDWSHRERLFRA